MRLFSSQVWVMPSLVPSSPLRLRSKVLMTPLISWASELDLDVDAGRQIETHQRVHRLRRGVDDVDQPLVRAHLEVLAGVLVLVGRADDAVDVLLRRQRHRAGHLRARTGHGVHDLPRRGVDHLVVIGLEPDADLLSRHQTTSLLSSPNDWSRTPSVRWSALLLLASASDPRGRACRGIHDARDAHDLVLVVVWSGARGAGLNGISWCGADMRDHYHCRVSSSGEPVQ